jgi:rhodanese-related sulfurtransferase
MKIQAMELAKALQSGKRVALFDVRTPVEYAEEHIEGSVQMPVGQWDAQGVASDAAQSDLCVLICQSGKRAEHAHDRFLQAGCSNLMILEGGVSAWKDAGMPLVRGISKRLPLMRQVQLVIGVHALLGSVLALTVNKNFAFLPAFLGAGLTLAGSTGWCGLAILLSKMPWNRVNPPGTPVQSCIR